MWRTPCVGALPRSSLSDRSGCGQRGGRRCCSVYGSGLRWALMGPNLIYHLGGGPGGIRHFLEQFTGPMTACWADLGSPNLGPELQKKIVDGVLEEADGRSFEALSQERDTLIIGLLQLLSHRAKAEPVAACGHTADDS